MEVNTTGGDLSTSSAGRSLPNDSGPGPRRSYPYLPMIFMMLVAVFQSYAATGLLAVLELYFTTFLYVCFEDSSKLGTISVNFQLAAYQVCSLSGGLLADALLGNFNTQLASNILNSAGLCLLAFSSFQWQITVDHVPCCTNDSSICKEIRSYVSLGNLDARMSKGLIVAIALMGLLLFSIGYGQTNAIQSVFIGDQFDGEESKEKKRSFSWFYFFSNVGNLFGEAGMPILGQTYGFVIAVFTATGASVLSTVIFTAGCFAYTRKKPKTPQCLKKASQCCSIKGPTAEEGSLLKATPMVPTQSQKHETRKLMRELLGILMVFGPLVVFWGIFYQQNSTWVLQGTYTNCYLGRLHIPPDLMPSLEDFFVLLVIPFLYYMVYPHLEKTMKIKILPVHKIIAGMVMAAFSFLLSALLQLYLNSSAQYCHGDISILWQVPQFLAMAFAEVLVSVTGLEFAYTQAPSRMRNLVTSLWYITQALGAALNIVVALIPILLLYQFVLYVCLMVVDTVFFVVLNWKFKYKEQSTSIE